MGGGSRTCDNNSSERRGAEKAAKVGKAMNPKKSFGKRKAVILGAFWERFPYGV